MAAFRPFESVPEAKLRAQLAEMNAMLTGHLDILEPIVDMFNDGVPAALSIFTAGAASPSRKLVEVLSLYVLMSVELYTRQAES